MKTYNIAAASPFRDETIEPVQIVIDTPLVDYQRLDACIAQQWDEARKLHDALSGAIPQGIMSKLFALMAQRYAVNFINSEAQIAEMSKAGE